MNETTTIEELCALPVFRNVRDLIFTHPDRQKYRSMLGEYGFEKCGFEEALQDLAIRCQQSDFRIPLYPEVWENAHQNGEGTDEIAKEMQELPEEFLAKNQKQSEEAKAEVCLLNYAVHPGKPYVLILPGGAYNREWMLVEGYPIATKIHQLGYNAFILVYRCGYFGCLKDALQDVETAVRYLKRHARELDIRSENYALCGFSAGGHLASGFALEYRERKQTPAPKAVLLAYPGTCILDFYSHAEKLRADGKMEEAGAAAQYLYRMFGEQYSRDDVAQYDLSEQMTEDFPKTYLIHMEDDRTVPVAGSKHLVEKMEKKGIPYMARFGKNGGHSFGLGVGTDAEGWLPEAVSFWQSEENES